MREFYGLFYNMFIVNTALLCFNSSTYEGQRGFRKLLSCTEDVFTIDKLTQKHREYNRLQLLS